MQRRFQNKFIGKGRGRGQARDMNTTQTPEILEAGPRQGGRGLGPCGGGQGRGTGGGQGRGCGMGRGGGQGRGAGQGGGQGRGLGRGRAQGGVFPGQAGNPQDGAPRSAEDEITDSERNAAPGWGAGQGQGGGFGGQRLRRRDGSCLNTPRNPR